VLLLVLDTVRIAFCVLRLWRTANTRNPQSKRLPLNAAALSERGVALSSKRMRSLCVRLLAGGTANNVRAIAVKGCKASDREIKLPRFVPHRLCLTAWKCAEHISTWGEAAS